MNLGDTKGEVALEMTSPDSMIERYQKVMEISRDLASTLDLDVLLRRIVAAATMLCNAEQASILLYDQAKHELYFEASTNLNQPQIRGVIVPVESSIAGWIVTNRQPVILSDASHDSRHYGLISQLTKITTASLLGVPLIHKNNVIGALETINKLSGDFTDEDKDILTTLGAQAAVAIENARLFQQSDLISELVHELRTPLSSLSTAVHLVLRADVPNEQRQRIAQIIRDEISRLSDLTSSFLDLSRLESGRAQFQMNTFDIKRLLEDCCEMQLPWAAEKNLELSLWVEPGLPKLTADQDKIKQVVINLINNGIKYNRPGGKVTVKATADQDEFILTVGDTGPGIPAESLPKLFTRFYRVPGLEKYSTGTGLGLSICKRIVEAHHGKIEVQSEVGIGSTFKLTLPLLSASQ
jgi:signal transduction histidine kinase